MYTLSVQTKSGPPTEPGKLKEWVAGVFKSFSENPVKWKSALFKASTVAIGSGSVTVANAAGFSTAAELADCFLDPVSALVCAAFRSSDVQATGCQVLVPPNSPLPKNEEGCMDLNPLSVFSRNFLSLSEDEQRKVLSENPEMCTAVKIQDRRFNPQVKSGNCKEGKIFFTDGTIVSLPKEGGMDFSFDRGVARDRQDWPSYRFRPNRKEIWKSVGRTSTPYRSANPQTSEMYQEVFSDLMKRYGSFIPAATEISNCCFPTAGVNISPAECASKFPALFASSTGKVQQGADGR